MAELDNRRPIKSRDAGWAHRAAAVLAHANASPDLISAASFAFSALGAAVAAGCAAMTEAMAPLRAAPPAGRGGVHPAAPGLRSLLDGMVAVEHGRSSPAGAIWNELPDRFSDVALLAGAGYCAAGGGLLFAVEIGWLCASLALLTAYPARSSAVGSASRPTSPARSPSSSGWRPSPPPP